MLLFLFSCTDYNLYTKAEDEPVVEVELFPNIVVEPTSLDLGIICGRTENLLHISNQGQEVLQIASMELGGSGWQILREELAFSIEVGTTVDIPIQSGEGNGYLLIVSNDPDQPQISIPLFATQDKAPTIEMITPYHGEILEMSTNFQGLVSDDVDAPESLMIQWLSNQDGIFSTAAPQSDGTIEALWSDSHQSGEHSIELMVADSCGNIASEVFDICQQQFYEAENFNISTWNFEGSATWDTQNDWLQLTSPIPNEAGSAFSTAQIVSGAQVEIEFLFYMSDGSGADGISLTALDVDRMTSFFGGSGGGIGYSGLPGWSIEIDNYYNATQDPTPSDHLAFSFDGSGYPLAWAELPDMEDGNWHQMLVQVQAPHVFVSIDNVTYLDQDIAGFYNFDAYVGFTAATGMLTNRHLIDSLTIQEQICGD